MEAAVDELFKEPAWDYAQLTGAIIDALRKLAGKLKDSPRTIQHIATVLVDDHRFQGIKEDDVRKAVSELAAASQGALVFTGETLTVLTSYDDLARRSASLTGANAKPFRLSKLRDDLNGGGAVEH